MDIMKHGITIQRLAFTFALIAAVLLSAINKNDGFYISNYVILSAFSLLFIYRILFQENRKNYSKMIFDLEPQEKALAGLNAGLVIAWFLCQISYFQ